jgi:alpha-1,6-mannosyltransferase
VRSRRRSLRPPRRARPLKLARPASGPLLAGAACLVLLGLAVGAAFPETSPLSPDNRGGNTTWSWIYLGAIVASFAAYLGGLALLERVRVPLTPVLVVAVAIQVAPLAGPVLLSTDAYTYWAYGRLAAVRDANPYETPPSAFPEDPAFERMGSRWHDTTSVYGPAFTLASEGLAEIGGDSPAAAAWTYRALAATAMLALVALAAVLARRRSLAAAFVGWNPLLAVHFAGGGHNDAWMMALVLGALALGAARRPAAAGAAWALAVAIKWVALVLLPLRIAAERPRLRWWLGLAATAAVLAGLATWAYGLAWVEAFGPVADNLRDQARYSIPHRLTGLGLSETAAAALTAALFGLAYLWLLREAWRGRPRLGLAAGLLLVATTWLVPWYAVWAVPLAAVEEDDRPARLLALALSAYLLRDAVPL